MKDEAKAMCGRAKAYISFVAAAGLGLLALGVFRGEFPDPGRFLVFLVFALLASTLKVRLPRITGTISVNFLFILVAIALFSFSETVLLGCASALLQSVWKPGQKPKPVQVLFNVACLAISIGVAYGGSHSIVAATGRNSLAILLTLGACLFFIANTGLVAGVLSLVEVKPLSQVWPQCYAWSFPYYLVGAAIAGLVCASTRSAGWAAALLVLPLMYLTYVCYRLCVHRMTRGEN